MYVKIILTRGGGGRVTLNLKPIYAFIQTEGVSKHICIIYTLWDLPRRLMLTHLID